MPSSLRKRMDSVKTTSVAACVAQAVAEAWPRLFDASYDICYSRRGLLAVHTASDNRYPAFYVAAASLDSANQMPPSGLPSEPNVTLINQYGGFNLEFDRIVGLKLYKFKNCILIILGGNLSNAQTGLHRWFLRSLAIRHSPLAGRQGAHLDTRKTIRADSWRCASLG